MTTSDPSPAVDPVLARRALIARLVRVGKRLGYGLFAASMILFFVALNVGFTDLFASTIVACMLVGSVVLAPAIVFDYGVKAAVRDER